jgi:alpha-1,2-mannosyltransferase
VTSVRIFTGLVAWRTSPATDAGITVHPLKRTGVHLLVYGIALCAILPRLRLTLDNEPDRRMMDLAVYRMGGQGFLQSRQLYGMVTQFWHLPFTYPPISALFAAPLALVSWRSDQLIWVFAICVSVIVCIRLACRPLLMAVGRYAPMAVAALFVLFIYLAPMRDELQFGQVDIILLALCVGDCLTEKPRWPRGLLIGVATAIKLIPGVFIIYLLISRRTKAARTAAISAVGCTVLGFAITPRDSIEYWDHQVFNMNRIGSSSSTSNQSLHGLMLHLSGHSTVPFALWAGLALIVAAFGFACARRMSHTGNDITGVAIVALLSALLSPISWIHEYVVIIVVICAVVSHGRPVVRIAGGVLITIIFTLPIPHWGTQWLGIHAIPAAAMELVRSAYTVTALLIIAVFWIAQIRTARQSLDNAEEIGWTREDTAAAT